MEFDKLISDFAVRHSIEGLSVEGDIAALDIDGIVVGLNGDGGMLVMTAEIGEPPAEGRDIFAEMLLEANFSSDFVFAKSSENGNYVMTSRVALDGLDGEAFDAALEALVNRAEAWRKLLEDFRPAAEEAAAMEEPVAFGNDGFMQV